MAESNEGRQLREAMLRLEPTLEKIAQIVESDRVSEADGMFVFTYLMATTFAHMEISRGNNPITEMHHAIKLLDGMITQVTGVIVTDIRDSN